MFKRISKVFLIATTVALSGCASQSMLPPSSSEADFSAPEGKVGWSSYRETALFRNASEEHVYDAAKLALGETGFALRSADRSARRVTGEHGITLHDWNVIAGIYYKPTPAGIHVLVQVEGSKDTGFSGDVTGDGWTGKIMSRMRQHIGR
ncbi:hypothetical protein BMG00_11060 [Thioclava marina]|uniref:Lipoprotein n=1 Tax=Thioclava marina TaxID=1915077 RepID=A0ABX3MJE6_9RHOB|nr:hypothetical protein [Thioclava marina]OOY11639.1 hypothetical protein BMG00_11060 [Thioclava marina]